MAVSTTRLAALATVFAAVLLASGCGGGSSSSNTKPAEDWANSVCSAITTWTSSVRQTGNELRGNVSKDSLNKAVNEFESSTKQLGNDLKGLGRPDTSSGQKAQASVEKLATEIQSDADKIKTEIKGASGVTGYQKALSSVGLTLQQMGQQVTSTFSELGSLDAKGELKSAFKKADKCSSLVKQSG